MKIYIRNSKRPVVRRATKACAEFVGQYLLSSKSFNTTTVNIDFLQYKPPRHQVAAQNVTLGDFEEMAWCVWEDDDNIRPQEYRVELLDHPIIGLRTKIENLVHEMVHVAQMRTGRMKHSARLHLVKWDGKWVDESKIDYWDLPWEVDAIGRERGLTLKFAKHLQENDPELFAAIKSEHPGDTPTIF